MHYNIIYIGQLIQNIIENTSKDENAGIPKSYERSD